MAKTFFFYDVETSGTDPAYQRIMQFAGQRTDENLQTIGKPVNVLVKLTEDILPEPDAILIHGITPQQTLSEGLSEPEFLHLLEKEVFTPDTILAGYNNIRFDDEFVRHTLWRNFYDPYEWHWKDGRSRWDLLDAVRMTRALRPDGIEWPVEENGVPTNRLGAITAANNITLDNAHDALSDILATIDIARMLKSQQPKLYNYLLKVRNKREVANIVGYDLDNKQVKSNQPFIYTSSRYPSEHAKTTVAVAIGPMPGDSNGVLVYDLRHDPRPYTDLNIQELGERIFVPQEKRDELSPLPVKKLSLNRSPAIAPIGTFDDTAAKNIHLSQSTIATNLKRLSQAKGFSQLVYDAFKDREKLPRRNDVEGQLYEGFLGDDDKKLVSEVRQAGPDKLADWHPNFSDERLRDLLLRYKARNWPSALSDKEQIIWESWRTDKLLNGVDTSMTFKRFSLRLQELATKTSGKDNQYLLEELQLYGQSIAPAQLFDL